MSNLARAFGLAVLLVVGSAVAAPAEEVTGRKEFPLKYRMCVFIDEECSAAGQYVQPNKSKPALKEEPKYQSKEPLYAEMRLGAKKDRYTLVLDCSTGGNRGYDTLFVDADRDGRISPQEKVAVVPGGRGTSFGPVKVMVDCGHEKCPQWFVFQLYEYNYEPGGQAYRQLTVRNAGYYQGVVSFGDQKRLLAVVDNDGDGLFNKCMKGADWSSDRLLLDLNGDGKLDGTYQSEEAQPLGKYIQVGERYWRLDVAADGSSVHVEPLNKPLGTLHAEQKDVTLLLGHDEGVLRVRSKDGTARVPAGKYQLVQCNYSLIDKAGQKWEFSSYSYNQAGSKVDVPPDGSVKIAFGPPLVPKVNASVSGDGDLTMNLELRGAGGEIYNNVQLPNYQRPPVPRAKILDAAGKQLAVLDFHYG